MPDVSSIRFTRQLNFYPPLTRWTHLSHPASCYVEENAQVALGQFNRRENDKTQPKSLALIQVASGEVWGKTRKDGFEPSVQAYAGKLKNRRGIDFTTLIDPHPDGSPFEVSWYLTATPGVEYRCKDGEDFACIKAAVTNMQP